MFLRFVDVGLGETMMRRHQINEAVKLGNPRIKFNIAVFCGDKWGHWGHRINTGFQRPHFWGQTGDKWGQIPGVLLGVPSCPRCSRHTWGRWKPRR